MQRPEALTTAKSLRMPIWKANEKPPPSQRVEEYGDYIALTAYWQGELSALVLDTQAELSDIEDEWAALEGYEIHRDGRKTDRSVDEAKAQAAPDLAKRRREKKRLLKMLNEEVDRLERESVKASRIVTTIIGK